MDESPLTAEMIVRHARNVPDPAQRQAYLDQACESNTELRQRVESLLHSGDAVGEAPDRAAATLDTSDVAPGQWLDPKVWPPAPLESVGSRIGPYKLLQQIGEGGMGVVFMAEQQEPVRRLVALKVIKAGMDSAQVIARFEAERQALALMDHPNIARVLGADHPDILAARDHLALAYQEAHRVAEAIRLHEQNLKQRESRLGADDAATFSIRNNLANAYLAAGRSAEAIRLHEQNLKLHEARFGTDHPDTLTARNNLADAYLAAGRTAEAIPLLQRTLKQKESKLGPDHPDTLASRHNLANAYRALGRTADALQLHQQNLKLCEAKLGADHPHTLIARDNLAESLDQAGEFTKAEPLYRQLLEQTRKRLGAQHVATSARMATLGLNLLYQHKYAEAEAILRDCLKVREDKLPDDWPTFNTRSLLGEALLGQKKYAEAEPLVLSGYEGMKQNQAKIPPQAKQRLVEAIERLVRLYEAVGKKEQADKWRKQREQARKTF